VRAWLWAVRACQRLAAACEGLALDSVRVWRWATRVSDPVRVLKRADSPPDRANRPRDSGLGHPSGATVPYMVGKARLDRGRESGVSPVFSLQGASGGPHGASLRDASPLFLFFCGKNFYLTQEPHAWDAARRLAGPSGALCVQAARRSPPRKWYRCSFTPLVLLFIRRVA